MPDAPLPPNDLSAALVGEPEHVRDFLRHALDQVLTRLRDRPRSQCVASAVVSTPGRQAVGATIETSQADRLTGALCAAIDDHVARDSVCYIARAELYTLRGRTRRSLTFTIEDAAATREWWAPLGDDLELGPVLAGAPR